MGDDVRLRAGYERRDKERTNTSTEAEAEAEAEAAEASRTKRANDNDIARARGKHRGGEKVGRIKAKSLEKKSAPEKYGTTIYREKKESNQHVFQ